MDQQLSLHEKADLTIDQGKIIEIAPSSSYRAKKTIEAKGKLVMPGLINAHTHAAMTLFRGAADDLPLDVWWQKIIFPLEKKYCNRDFVRIGTALATVEMIKSGTTSFINMYYHELEAGKVCQKIGLRVKLGEALLDYPTPNCQTPAAGLKYTEELVQEYRHDPLVSVAVAPHAPYTCSPEIYQQAQKLAEKLNIPIHTHVSETANEVAESRLKFGLTPAAQLHKIGLLSSRLIAVHCAHLSTEDIALLQTNQVKVVHCGESNMKLASGDAPIIELLNRGVTVGLGTDGAASNNNLDMFDEMDMAAKLHKLVSNDPQAMPAKTVLNLATSQGAKVFQQDNLGSLGVGQTADIIIIDLSSPHLTPMYNPYSHLVYAAGGSDVETVVINGKIVMADRKILTVDEKETIAEANELAARIRRDLPSL